MPARSGHFSLRNKQRHSRSRNERNCSDRLGWRSCIGRSAGAIRALSRCSRSGVSRASIRVLRRPQPPLTDLQNQKNAANPLSRLRERAGVRASPEPRSTVPSSASGTCTRAIPGARPSGGSAVQNGSLAVLSPARGEGKATLTCRPEKRIFTLDSHCGSRSVSAGATSKGTASGQAR